LSAILELATRLGIEVRREPLGGTGGGLCRLKDRRVLFVDTMADLATQCDRSLGGLARLAQVDDAFVIPELRDEIERRRKEGMRERE
jgi:hypothetical protein